MSLSEARLAYEHANEAIRPLCTCDNCGKAFRPRAKLNGYGKRVGYKFKWSTRSTCSDRCRYEQSSWNDMMTKRRLSKEKKHEPAL